VKTDEFFQAIDHDRVVEAIRAAESRSRGEIRVHVAPNPVEDAHAAARADFERLGMTRTKERNGVLILVAPESQTFAVLGDEGLHRHCPEGFWEDVVAAMRGAFREGRFTEGLVEAVARVGDVLARHFPRRPGETDVNELPDGISRG
jgi:uncharacterized membrane protein